MNYMPIMLAAKPTAVFPKLFFLVEVWEPVIKA
jgi:hypothetical protein